MAGISLPTIAYRTTSRRGVLRASAAFAALLGGVPANVPGARAEAPADPLVPIPLPPQVPAREGVAPLADTRLWFWDTGGSGEPIVLLHPASGSALIWGYQQPVFAKAGYRVIAYSRRGYYNSQPIERAHPGIGSEDLHQLVEFLGLGKFHLVASAAGGSIASDYAFSHPERLLSLTISSNQFGVTDGEIIAAAARIRPRIWDEIPVEFRELGPSYRAANPDGFRLWVELERKSQVGDGSRQRPANRITEARLARPQGADARHLRRRRFVDAAIDRPHDRRPDREQRTGGGVGIRTLSLLGTARGVQSRHPGFRRQAPGIERRSPHMVTASP